MKNIIISENDNFDDSNPIISPKENFKNLETTILYFQKVIQKTLLSIQKYKNIDIIGANELNNATSNLEHLYVELDNNIYLLKNKTNHTKIKNNLQTINNELANLFKQFGTENLTDLLTITYGKDYLNSLTIDQKKYQLLNEYFHPINFKIMNWKNDRNSNYSEKVIEKNRIIEDFIIVEKSNNFDSFDLCRTSKNFYSKVYGIKIAVHNCKEKKTLIIAGIIDDILISCINSPFILEKIETLCKYKSNFESLQYSTFERFIQSLTLKEIVVYSNDELISKFEGYMNQIILVKQKTISQVVKEFINNDLFGQRLTLIQLLIKSEDHEYQYLAYLLYDLLSNDNNGSIDSKEQTTLFDSLPWKIKSYFKDAMKKTIQYTNNLSDFDNSKIPLEQQICLLKASDSIKEKAMTKLKEVKAKNDDSGSKARQYLEGLLKIPFGIYRTEPVLSEMDNIKTIYKQLLLKFNNDNNLIENKTSVTNIEIKNNCTIIKNHFTNNNNNKLFQEVKKHFVVSKRNQLIINICKINDIIKILKLKKHKLIHSGKKIEFMQNQILQFLDEYQNDETVLNKMCTTNNINFVSLSNSIKEDLSLIDSKWSIINNYMNNISNIFDDAVHGHKKAKRQVQRIIAQWINGEQTGYSFGFEGPPGCGKTSFAKKGLAKCLLDENNEPRPFSFIAIGGQDNGSTLNGHNYTYVGSEWGKIVDILIKHKCMNPIIFIDELDKVSKTEHGKEIIGILTHLIDPTQNDGFQDKYFSGIDLDLSKVLFIFSYNDVSLIDKILLDRIHRIKFEHLSIEDKLVVTRKHILPEIYKNMGLENMINITDENIVYIIQNYTNEPGIRKFKELLFEIIGEINLTCLQNYDNIELPIHVSNEDIKFKYLKDYHEIIEKSIPDTDSVGVINGLWANSMGQGGIIPIETLFFSSSSFLELKLTGMQGDVMKESMTVAKTLALNLLNDSQRKKLTETCEKTKLQGIHIHCPEGAVPKDGPSAGTAITMVLYSLLSNKKIKRNIAITGEINLQGKVTAIGGLDLKILGGIRGGVTEFLYPKENAKDFKDFKEKYQDKNILDNILFHEIDNIKQVMELIFLN
jgi:ATP-dependent Lon protease